MESAEKVKLGFKVSNLSGVKGIRFLMLIFKIVS